MDKQFTSSNPSDFKGKIQQFEMFEGGDEIRNRIGRREIMAVLAVEFRWTAVSAVGPRLRRLSKY